MLDAIARPFGMLLMVLYNLVSNYGVAIFFVALVIKVILLPFQMKSKRGMMRQASLQPRIAELQKKHGTNKAKLNEETMKLYKEEGVSPASGCIWGFLPLPILLAFFQVIRYPLTTVMGVASSLLEEGGQIIETLMRIEAYNPEGISAAYLQIHQAQVITNNFSLFEGIENLSRIDFSFLGIDLGITPQWDFLWNADVARYGTWVAGFVLFLIPLISGGMQFLATSLNKKLNPSVLAEGQAKSMNKMMMFMPLLSVYFAFITPAALGFYWTISTALQIVQDLWLTKVFTKKIVAEEAVKNEERAKKEAELEAKRLETERKKAEGLVEQNPNTSKRKKIKSSKQGQIEKQAEWQKKNAPADAGAYEPSRVGNRRYARGRAYLPERFGVIAAGEDEAGEIAEIDEYYDVDEFEETDGYDDADEYDESDEYDEADEFDETSREDELESLLDGIFGSDDDAEEDT